MKGSVWILGIQKEIKNTELHYHFVCTDAIVCTVSAENWSTGRVDPCMLWPLMLFSESTLKKNIFAIGKRFDRWQKQQKQEKYECYVCKFGPCSMVVSELCFSEEYCLI